MNEEDRFKFIDDLSVLEIVNWNWNWKSQEWLDTINGWTVNQKMLVNEKKTKTIIFHYTKNYQFTTRLSINDKDIDVIDSTRLIQNDLRWDLNTKEIV